MKEQKIVIFDYETGGVKPEHPNIQLAAIAVDQKWNEVESFERKIKFDPAKCSPEALEINHYDSDAWKDAIPESEVFREFAAFLSKHATMEQVSKRTGNPYTVARIAAYNFNFDKDRLWAMSRGNFVPAYPQGLCLMQRAMWFALDVSLPVENFRLTSVAHALGIPIDDAHDALGDVRMSAAVAKKIEDAYGRAVQHAV